MTRDLEPAVTAGWRAIDKLSIAEPAELAPHYLALIEIREKLDLAIELASQRKAA